VLQRCSFPNALPVDFYKTFTKAFPRFPGHPAHRQGCSWRLHSGSSDRIRGEMSEDVFNLSRIEYHAAASNERHLYGPRAKPPPWTEPDLRSSLGGRSRSGGRQGHCGVRPSTPSQADDGGGERTRNDQDPLISGIIIAAVWALDRFAG
jgi:hypothetical protein